MSKSNDAAEGLMYLIGFIIAIFLIAGKVIINHATVETVTITVESKERVNNRNKGKYLIFTDGEVFQNVDMWTFGKFNSSDIYGQLDEDSTYAVKVCGIRVPLFSWYRNILEIEE